MREIRSPLDGILSPFAARFVDAYAVQGLSPLLVADFTTPYYRKAGTTSTFSDTFTHSRLGNATMVDSDGLIKWAPHNLALNSAAPATQSITVVSGADYTVEITGSGSVALTGAGTGTVTAGNPVEITASTTTLTLTVTGTPSTMWAYRSGLGGMVNNPDTGTSYVPTTSAAVHQARRNHYTYNGTSWVNSGLLLETEARTNLVTSSTPNDTAWSVSGEANWTPDALTQHGVSFSKFVPTNAASSSHYRQISATSAAQERVASMLVSLESGSAINKISLYPGGSSSFAHFNMSALTTSNEANVTEVKITEFSAGVYLIYARWPSTLTQDRIRIYASSGALGASATTENGTDGIYIGAVQYEAGPTPSSYIPTVGATATRPTESLQIAAADMPWPTPNVIGAELVTNGDGSTLTGWSDDSEGSGSAAATGGVFVLTNGGSTNDEGIISQTLTTVTNNVYLLEVDRPSGNIIVQLGTAGSGSSNIYQSNNSTGPISLPFKALSTATTVTIRNFNFTGDAQADNISVREIDPLSVSLQMEGKMTYADTNSNPEARLILWANGANYIRYDLRTDSARTGALSFYQSAPSGLDQVATADDYYSPDVLVPYNIASRHGSTFVNGATDGTALTADTTPIALPDLSATNFSLGYDYMGTIAQFRAWNKDIGDAGIAEASS